MAGEEPAREAMVLGVALTVEDSTADVPYHAERLEARGCC